MIESGKVDPTAHTLKVIASRLGTSVQYLVDEPFDATRVIHLLLKSGRRLFEQKACAEAVEYFATAAELSLGTDNGKIEVECKEAQAFAEYEAGLIDEALASSLQAAELYHSLHLPSGQAKALLVAGNCSFTLNQFRQARQYYTRVLAIVGNLKQDWELHSRVLRNLGSTFYRLGQWERSAEYFRDSALIAHQGPDPLLEGYAFLGLSAVMIESGDIERAKDPLVTAEQLLVACGDEFGITAVRCNRGIHEMRRGSWETGRSLVEHALRYFLEARMSREIAAATHELAKYWEHRRKPRRAIALCEEALKAMAPRQDKVEKARIYETLARLYNTTGDLKTASHYEELSKEMLGIIFQS